MSEPERPHRHVPGLPHVHPQPAAPPGDEEASGGPRLGIVGGGHVGPVLGRAFATAGWSVPAAASRSEAGRERLRAALPEARVFAEPAAVLDEVEICLLAVPDDAIASVVETLRCYGGQGLAHTSGLLPAAVLEPAMAAGSTKASFHPLVAFADASRAAAALHGATVAIEGDDRLVAVLAELAEAIGAQPARLAADAKAAYHAAAVLAAAGFVALLDAIAAIAAGAGLDEAEARAVYLPLSRQILDEVEAGGIRAALTGPIARGDAGTVRIHVATLAAAAPQTLETYRAVARRELVIAQDTGRLDAEAAEAVRAVLDGPSAAARPS